MVAAQAEPWFIGAIARVDIRRWDREGQIQVDRIDHIDKLSIISKRQSQITPYCAGDTGR